MSRRISIGAIIAIAVLLLVVLVMDVSLMFGQFQQQTRDAGFSQLESINKQLDESIGDAERLTMEIAIEAREVLDDRGGLERFLYEKKAEVVKGDSGAFNVYAAGGDWWIIPDFDSPDDYVAQERAWYKGAVRNGGKVYLSSPYQDAMTGDMCYTVAVMLGDGETVVAVDYTMDTVQTYIEQLHGKGTRHAAIVTDDGVIAGCSDEELIGKHLAAAIPEFSGIWSLSKRSDDFVTARMASDFLYENLFAAKTGGNWILIVSISDGELYGTSYVQLVVTIVLIVALFVTALLAFVLARRSQRRAGEDALQRKRYRGNRREQEARGISKRYRNRILAFMAIVMAFSLYAIVSATYSWGTAQMQSETEEYEHNLSKWVDTQKSVLDMFASAIAADPGMLNDYQGTIDYLNGITEQFPEISVSYFTNPALDPPVYMNNGWMPDDDVVIEERPWYAGALESEDGWCMTAPYFDNQTGGYCVTISEQVHDAKTGEFLGVFGIDFYMDKLVGIMGDSYGDQGYAFLVDAEGYIVNHPYGEYQMSESSQTSILELPYGKVKTDGQDVELIRDYDGSPKVLMAKADKTSKFSVYVVSDALAIYGRVILYSVICLAAFIVCIVIIYRHLSGMIAWQEEVNRRLEKAAQTDAMTGLLNKVSAEEALTQAAKQKTGALLVIDLDSFKLVNDLYGHEMGDRVLVRFAALIQSAIRDGDIAGRIGGDEFAVFCEGLTDEGTIEKKMEYLNGEIIKSAKEYMGSGMEIPLGCSAGVALVPREGREYGMLFAKADLALHQAKRGGKHGVKIYGDQDAAQAEEGTGDLSNLQMIFGERNAKKAALVADRELFQEIYRYMARLTAVNGWRLHLVDFTLRATDEGERADCAERFIELAADLLRGYDVILKYNDSQVIVLLTEPEDGDYAVPIDRVLDAWKREGTPGVGVSYQHEQVTSR